MSRETNLSQSATHLQEDPALVTAMPQAADEVTEALEHPQSANRVVGLIRRHWLLSAFLVAGALLRVVVTLTYWPALELNGDSLDYLQTARSLRPSAWHPAVYPLFLRALFPVGNLGVVTILQHLMGLGLGVLIYVLLLRLGARRWLAALGALPVLLDGFQLDIEQLVLAETLTDVLLVGGLAVLLWRRQLTTRFAAVAGILLALASLTRDAALAVLVVVAVYLIVRKWWRALLSFCVAAGALLVAYGFWYMSTWGNFGLDGLSGYFLYGRVAPFANCQYHLSAEEAQLCPSQPVSQRPYNTDYYVWLHGSPLYRAALGSGSNRNNVAKSFSEKVILNQPLAYLESVWRDTWQYFVPGHSVAPNAGVMDSRRGDFPPATLHSVSGDIVNGNVDPLNIFFAFVGLNGQRVQVWLHPTLMAPLRAYQSVVYTQGPLLLACLVGAVVVGLPLRRSNARRRRARWAALLLAMSGLALAVLPSITTGFAYRYQIPLLVLLPPAGVLAADIAGDAVGPVKDLRRRLSARGTAGLLLDIRERSYDGSGQDSLEPDGRADIARS